MKRIVISALSGSTGKTFVTLGLIRAFARRGLKVRAFKKGPDYIDTAWHELASGRSACNLDLFFMREQVLRELFVRKMQTSDSHLHSPPIRPAEAGATVDQDRQACDLAVIEGNRGLFDGLDKHGSCSTAGLAKALKAPVILVINATKMTRTAAALVNGCAGFEKGLDLAGVIANRTGGERHGKLLADCVKEYCAVPFLGALPRLKVNPILERATGLIALDELPEIDQVLNELAAFMEKRLDLDKILELAAAAEDLQTEDAASPRGGVQAVDKAGLSGFVGSPPQSGVGAGRLCRPSAALQTPSSGFVINLYAASPQSGVSEPASTPAENAGPRIGYVHDAALWFLYQENLEALQKAGARLQALKLLEAADWPALDGLYLPGGAVESFIGVMQSALGDGGAWSVLVKKLRRLSAAGLPIYAEGVGAWLTGRELEFASESYPMSGIFPLKITHGEQKRGLGYVKAEARAGPFFTPGTTVLGHEFNYAVWEPLDARPPLTAYKIIKGAGLHKALGPEGGDARDGFFTNNTQASSTQLHALANPDWAVNFTRLAQEYKTKKRCESSRTITP